MSQHGMGEGKGPLEASSFLRELIENQEMEVLTTDMSKAFDMVAHKDFRKAIDKVTETGSAERRLLHSEYKNLTAYIQMGNEMGPIFPIQRGIRQGDPMSAALFCVVMAQIIEETTSLTEVNTVAYVEDVVLAHKREEGIAQNLDAFEEGARKRGLILNKEKCHRLTNENKIKFLGLIHAKDKAFKEEIARRISKADDAARKAECDINAFERERKAELGIRDRLNIMQMKVITHLDYLVKILGDEEEIQEMKAKTYRRALKWKRRCKTKEILVTVDRIMKGSQKRQSCKITKVQDRPKRRWTYVEKRWKYGRKSDWNVLIVG